MSKTRDLLRPKGSLEPNEFGAIPLYLQQSVRR